MPLSFYTSSIWRCQPPLTSPNFEGLSDCYEGRRQIDLQKVCSCFKWAVFRYYSPTAKHSQHKGIIWQVLTNISSLEPAPCLRDAPFTKANLTSADIPHRIASMWGMWPNALHWAGSGDFMWIETFLAPGSSQYSNRLSKSTSILPTQAST